jgi:tellurite resistance protein
MKDPDFETEATTEQVVDQAAGEWAVVAMACIAFADRELEDSEVEKACQLAATTPVIRDTLGAEFGAQLFSDTVERIKASPGEETRFLLGELRQLAARVGCQETRDAAFQTLLAVATADRQIEPRERGLLLELKEIIGSNVMVPLAHLSVE